MTARQLVDRFNELYPVGTAVRYWPVPSGDTHMNTWTRCQAWMMGEEPMVMVKGVAGGVALWAVMVRLEGR